MGRQVWKQTETINEIFAIKKNIVKIIQLKQMTTLISIVAKKVQT